MSLQLLQGADGSVHALTVTQKIEGKTGQRHVSAENYKNRRKVWRLPEG